MTTITEDYVSSEMAKLLKEKGFDEPCYGRYSYRGGNVVVRASKLSNTDLCYHPDISGISAPTLQMAMKWLREVHKISIEITSTGYLVDNDVEWECDIKAGHRLYFKHITNEKSFELCAEAAIKYCLENLI